MQIRWFLEMCLDSQLRHSVRTAHGRTVHSASISGPSILRKLYLQVLMLAGTQQKSLCVAIRKESFQEVVVEVHSHYFTAIFVLHLQRCRIRSTPRLGQVQSKMTSYLLLNDPQDILKIWARLMISRDSDLLVLMKKNISLLCHREPSRKGGWPA